MKKSFSKTLHFLKSKFDEQSKILFKNSSWVFLANFIGTALGFIRSVVIARGLGAETFGSYAIVVAFVGIVQEFINLNIGTAIIRFGAIYHKEQRIDKLTALIKHGLKFSIVTIIISVIVITALITISYSTFISKPGLTWFIIFYSFAASTKYFNSLSQGILRLYFKFRLNSTIQIVMDIVETILVVLSVLLYPKNLNVFFITMIISRFLNGLICNWMAFVELRKEFLPYMKVKVEIIEDEIKTIKNFVLGNSLGNSLKSVLSQGDVVLLGALAGPSPVALYAVAKKLGYSILVLTDPFISSIYPQFSKLLAEHKYIELKKMLKRITLLSLAPSVLCVIFGYFLSEWAIVTVFGKEYLDAARPFFWLLLGGIYGTLTFWVVPLVQSLGLVKFRLKMYTIAIIAGSSIAYLLIPSMKAAGMAIALLCANLIIEISFIIKSYSLMGKKQ